MLQNFLRDGIANRLFPFWTRADGKHRSVNMAELDRRDVCRQWKAPDSNPPELGLDLVLARHVTSGTSGPDPEKPKGNIMKQLSRGLLAAGVAVGALLTSVPASAATRASVAEQNASAHTSTPLRPPVIEKVRYTCHAEGAIVAIKLRNPNRVELAFQLQLSGPDLQDAQTMTLPSKTSEWAEFHGTPDGEYLIEALDAQGDVVTRRTGTVVECSSGAFAALRHRVGLAG